MNSQKQKKNTFNGARKLIATILIISMILSLSFNIFLFKPKKARAFLGIGDITIDIVNQLKDWVVDQVPRIIARHMMVRLQQEIARWAQGGFTDENRPFAMTSWKQEITDALNLASARFINEFGLTPLCAPLRFTLGERLGLTQGYAIPYTQYAACTMEAVVGNVKDFYENPSIGMYGWDTWTALAQPQNNIYGAFLLAAQRKAEIESEEKAEKEMQKDIGQGYRPEQECMVEQSMTEEQMEECKNQCYEEGVDKSVSWTDACLAECEKRDTGICLEYKTKNLGSSIHSAIEKTIGSDIDWLISADEITEMFNLVFSGLLNKLVHGTGLSKQPFYRPTQTISKYQAQYSYQESYKKTQSPEDIKKLRTDILTNILKAIKNLTTASYECDKKYQLKGDIFSEVIYEILEEETQHLYAGIEGANIKPDYEVLDPKNASFFKYGDEWYKIPYEKYPPECSKITKGLGGIPCRDILTNLPYELDLNNINAECTTGCLGRINEYRENEYSDNEAINKTVADGKCSSFAIGNACLQGAYLIDKTKNTCDECVKKAQQQCENKTDPIEKENCVKLYCSNYEDINASIVDANDFYNRCQAASLKNSCYTCLKEYFIPADYCHQIADYINRAFILYPAYVYDSTVWGKGSSLIDCDENRADAFPKLGLVCRIDPDYEVEVGTLKSGKLCEQCKNTTPEQLKSIIDFKPTDDDCSELDITVKEAEEENLTAWVAKGLDAVGASFNFLRKKRSKCYYALSGEMPVTTLPTPSEEEDSCAKWNSNYKGAGALSNMSLEHPDRSFSEEIPKASAYTNNATLVSIKEPNRFVTL